MQFYTLFETASRAGLAQESQSDACKIKFSRDVPDPARARAVEQLTTFSQERKVICNSFSCRKESTGNGRKCGVKLKQQNFLLLVAKA